MTAGQSVHETVEKQLEKILNSAEFDASERNRQFLRHIVEETLAGRADRIKAYTIATVVFGRGSGFDPQLDSIVRIEAGRLRRSLERYYLTAGSNDRLRIAIPKGTYVPTFIERDDAAPPKQGMDHRDGDCVACRSEKEDRRKKSRQTEQRQCFEKQAGHQREKERHFDPEGRGRDCPQEISKRPEDFQAC
jgi:hypothetical protein